MVWEREDKRGFRFEDGNERTFKDGYYELLEPVPATGEAAAVLARLAVQVAQHQVEATGVPAGPSLTELVAVFREQYADGFNDPQWAARHRGEGSRRRVKRHRNAAVEHAATALSREALDAALAAKDAAGVLQRFVEVMAATDLVTSKQLDSLRKAPATLALAQAMRDLVHEPDPDGTRFDAVLKLLVGSPGGRPCWQLLSGMRALVDPRQDVCIRPSVFFAAMQTVNRGRGKKASPTGPAYERLVGVARQLRDRLVGLGEAPRDMFDVYDFIWDTCRPAAGGVLTELRARWAAEASAPVAVVAADDAADAVEDTATVTQDTTATEDAEGDVADVDEAAAALGRTIEQLAAMPNVGPTDGPTATAA
ncbi:MAG: hypothetical protein K0V04_21005 [Deltaproteobacteria bacterium]|nr:hypothetical protein [Deltaproteobacteria bacterium]